MVADKKREQIADTELDMVADMEIDKVANKVADMVAKKKTLTSTSTSKWKSNLVRELVMGVG